MRFMGRGIITRSATLPIPGQRDGASLTLARRRNRGEERPTRQRQYLDVVGAAD
jgi:hypothetical protein